MRAAPYLASLSLATALLATPALGDGRNEIVVNRQVMPGIWSVIADPSRPEGALVTVQQPAIFDATAYCQMDGWRVSKMGDEAVTPDHAVLRRNVPAGKSIIGDANKSGPVSDARAACERGDASMVTTKLAVNFACKKVKTTYWSVDSTPFQGPAFPRSVVQVKCQGFAKPQEKVPLWLAWSPSQQNNDTAIASVPRAGDWEWVRIQGDIWKTQQPGTVALKRYRKIDGTGDFLYTTKGPPPDFKYADTLGYIYEAGKQPAGTISLTRYFSSARKDYHLNERAEFNPTAEGYANPVLEGYLFARQ